MTAILFTVTAFAEGVAQLLGITSRNFHHRFPSYHG
jgi:hypothetical protein